MAPDHVHKWEVIQNQHGRMGDAGFDQIIACHCQCGALQTWLRKWRVSPLSLGAWYIAEQVQGFRPAPKLPEIERIYDPGPLDGVGMFTPFAKYLPIHINPNQGIKP